MELAQKTTVLPEPAASACTRESQLAPPGGLPLRIFLRLAYPGKYRLALSPQIPHNKSLSIYFLLVLFLWVIWTSTEGVSGH